MTVLPQNFFGAFYIIAMNNISSPKLSDIMNSSVVEHLNLATFYPIYKINIFFGAIRNACREERDVLSASVHYTLLKKNVQFN